MAGEADLLSSKFFWKNIYFSGLFREKHILFIPMIQGKTVFFLKNSWKSIPKNVYEPYLLSIYVLGSLSPEMDVICVSPLMGINFLRPDSTKSLNTLKQFAGYCPWKYPLFFLLMQLPVCIKLVRPDPAKLSN